MLTWWCAASPAHTCDALICDGAVRSGKTVCMALSFLCWATACFDGAQFGICGKSVSGVRRNVVAAVEPWLRRLGLRWTENRTEHYLELGCRGRSNRFYLFGGYDEKSAALIQGITFAGVLLDEAALMPRSFVEQACARCSVEGARLWFNCNPESPQHWFYREWILKAREKNALHLHFTMEDNPALSEAVKRRYRTTYSGAFYRRFVLGEWTRAQGLVYDFFDRERDCAAPVDEPCEAYAVSVDYGTANPASFGLWGRRGTVWYRIDEYYYASRREGKQKTDAEYVEELWRLLDGRRPDVVVVDPSAASFIEALRRTGLRVQKADNDVLWGIRVTAGMLKEKKLILCSNCADCLREMELYCWEEGAVRDVPRKEHDHAMDEMRYFAAYLAQQERGDGFYAAAVVRRAG
ncbi:PBSX family phage terminase large subunit [bacterium 210917-DFI.7.65]|nr:PBSX family phage terminase large subunit [bacterium 210917-DFI.7.65]